MFVPSSSPRIVAEGSPAPLDAVPLFAWDVVVVDDRVTAAVAAVVDVVVGVSGSAVFLVLTVVAGVVGGVVVVVVVVFMFVGGGVGVAAAVVCGDGVIVVDGVGAVIVDNKNLDIGPCGPALSTVVATATAVALMVEVVEVEIVVVADVAVGIGSCGELGGSVAGTVAVAVDVVTGVCDDQIRAVALPILAVV